MSLAKTRLGPLPANVDRLGTTAFLLVTVVLLRRLMPNEAQMRSQGLVLLTGIHVSVALWRRRIAGRWM